MSKQLIVTLILLSVLPSITKSQNALSPTAGARGIAIGKANLTYQDIHSVFNNQAGLAHLEGIAAVAFIENRFALEELNLVGFGVAIPTASGTFGLMVQYFGFQQFNEQKIGLNYSRKLLDNLAIGAQFDILNTRIAEYGNKAAITFELGLQYEIIDNITAGVHLFNPIRVSIEPEKELPSILQIGLTYQAAPFLSISSSIEKDTNLAYNFRAGLEYLAYEKIYFRAGINSNPNQVSFGLGFLLAKMQLNVSAAYHPVLGFSPSFGVSFAPS